MIKHSLSDCLADPDRLIRIQSYVEANVRFLGLSLVTLLVTIQMFRALGSPLRLNKPLVGRRSILEPRWLVGLRFTKGGRELLRQAYKKVRLLSITLVAQSAQRVSRKPQYKDEIFKVQCNDTEICVLPHRYVEELRGLPASKVSSPQALYNKGLGSYTGLEVIVESHLHFQAIQGHLKPNLASALGIVLDELQDALKTVLPDCSDEWVPFDVHTVLSELVSRLSSRVFGGLELARNQQWIQLSTAYPRNAFACTMALRMVPRIIRPLLAAVLPTYWRTRSNIRDAKRIVGGIITKRRADEGATDMSAKEHPCDLLQWMMNAAAGTETRADDLAHRLLFISDASAMTTSLLISHCLYDLVAHPEALSCIREEVHNVLREGDNFQKTTLHKMRSLDSALKESQRLNPPFLMTLDRVVREPLLLSDGTQLPVGTHLAMPTDAMLQDSSLLPQRGVAPDQFDPFRYARAREDPENAQRFQLATTEAKSLVFGHGKHACPGRFFASSEAKIILSHLLLLYDFRYPEGKGRPENWLFSENVAIDPNARLLIKKRNDAASNLAMLAKAL